MTAALARVEPMATPPTTPALVQAALAGDRLAFGRLHDRFAPMCHAIALARLPRGEAEEVVQESFLIAWQRLDELHDSARIGPWLARITRNRAIDCSRRRRQTTALSELDQPPGRCDPPNAEARQAIRAIQALPEAYRETLLMRLVEGMSGPEIAASTGMTPASVRVNLHRGMQKLRKALAVGSTR